MSTSGSSPIDALNLCRELEKYRPFFIEDPFPPSRMAISNCCGSNVRRPIAMGELFNSPHEWVGLISERLIDFIRVHLSQVGGLTVARKIATLAEWFGVRSAWHGPGDVSPVGHACNLHLDLAIPNFGIQESMIFRDQPGRCSRVSHVKNGYFHVNEAPGLGHGHQRGTRREISLSRRPAYWEPVRRRDGTSVRP